MQDQKRVALWSQIVRSGAISLQSESIEQERIPEVTGTTYQSCR